MSELEYPDIEDIIKESEIRWRSMGLMMPFTEARALDVLEMDGTEVDMFVWVARSGVVTIEVFVESVCEVNEFPDGDFDLDGELCKLALTALGRHVDNLKKDLDEVEDTYTRLKECESFKELNDD